MNYDVIDTVQGICNNVIVWDGISPWTPPPNCVTQPSLGTLSPGVAITLQGQTYQKIVQDAPTLPVSAVGNGSATINWAAVSGATSYLITRTTTTSVAIVHFTTTQTSYKDTTAVNGVLYTYTVSALGVNGYGTPSVPVTATPSAVAI